jgi:hypothetical protein
LAPSEPAVDVEHSGVTDYPCAMAVIGDNVDGIAARRAAS